MCCAEIRSVCNRNTVPPLVSPSLAVPINSTDVPFKGGWRHTQTHTLMAHPVTNRGSRKSKRALQPIVILYTKYYLTGHNCHPNNTMVHKLEEIMVPCILFSRRGEGVREPYEQGHHFGLIGLPVPPFRVNIFSLLLLVCVSTNSSFGLRVHPFLEVYVRNRFNAPM
jgi:hypothetical protein